MKQLRILSLILFCLMAASTSLSAQSSPDISWETVFNADFRAKGIGSVRWMKDGSYYSALVSQNNAQELRKVNLADESIEVLFNTQEWKDNGLTEEVVRVDNYAFSADESKVLIATEQESIWRRSRKAYYFIYDIQAKSLERLTDRKEKQSLAKFSPAGDQIAYVAENNLYIKDLKSGVEKAITRDGRMNKIINGATDWVYEEEFYLVKGWEWSPDGKHIAFLRFDESHVKEFVMEEWGGLYPDFTRFKYPKAGEENSVVDLYIYNVANEKSTKIDIRESKEQYLPRLNWTQNASVLSVRRMNRHQNQIDLIFVDVTDNSVKTVLTEKGPYWIDVNENLQFINKGKEFIWVSDQDGYNHIYVYGIDGKLKRQLTKGEWEVDQVFGYDEKTGRIFFTSTEDSPITRQLYSIKLNGRSKKQLTDKEGWHSIQFSRDLSYYIDNFSAVDTPNIYSLHKWDGKLVRILEDNQEAATALKEATLPTKEFITVPGEVDNDLLAYIIKPSNFDSTKAYPMLMYVYGGPRSQQIRDAYSLGGDREKFHMYLAEQGFLVACVDGRGTGSKGREFEKQVYKRLGEYETADQIAAAKYFGSLNYVDASRIAIWGWSYGGYMSSLCISKGNDVFKAAVAVAPVTHWKFYDTIYTERFMQTPQENPEGYEAYAPINVAKDIKPDSYFLIHGTGDDNVHYQNSTFMVDALVDANIPFRTMYYPNRNHGIYGGNTRRHLYGLIRSFVSEKLAN